MAGCATRVEAVELTSVYEMRSGRWHVRKRDSADNSPAFLTLGKPRHKNIRAPTGAAGASDRRVASANRTRFFRPCRDLVLLVIEFPALKGVLPKVIVGRFSLEEVSGTSKQDFVWTSRVVVIGGSVRLAKQERRHFGRYAQ